MNVNPPAISVKNMWINKLISLVLIIAAASNPRREDFADYVVDKVDFRQESTQVCESAKTWKPACENMFSAFGSGAKLLGSEKAESAIKALSKQNNYVVFSTFSLDAPGLDRRIAIGAFGNFFAVEKATLPKFLTSKKS